MKSIYFLLLLVCGRTSAQVQDQSSNHDMPLQDVVDAEEVDRWRFDPVLTDRDPFEAPESLIVKDVPDLFRYDLNDLTLIAVISGMGRSRAMLMLPNGTSIIVSEGDLVGRKQGKVVSISESELKVQSTYKDSRDREHKAITRLILAK